MFLDGWMVDGDGENGRKLNKDGASETVTS